MTKLLIFSLILLSPSLSYAKNHCDNVYDKTLAHSYIIAKSADTATSMYLFGINNEKIRDDARGIQRKEFEIWETNEGLKDLQDKPWRFGARNALFGAGTLIAFNFTCKSDKAIIRWAGRSILAYGTGISFKVSVNNQKLINLVTAR